MNSGYAPTTAINGPQSISRCGLWSRLNRLQVCHQLRDQRSGLVLVPGRFGAQAFAPYRHIPRPVGRNFGTPVDECAIRFSGNGFP